jgi:hypothetical protein
MASTTPARSIAIRGVRTPMKLSSRGIASTSLPCGVRHLPDVPEIVIAFHPKILDAITGMICGYAGPKGG